VLDQCAVATESASFSDYQLNARSQSTAQKRAAARHRLCRKQSAHLTARGIGGIFSRISSGYDSAVKRGDAAVATFNLRLTS